MPATHGNPRALPCIVDVLPALGDLRHFLETAAHQIEVAGLSRERLIHDADLPKRGVLPLWTIPPEVLGQLRAELGGAPEPLGCMVRLLLVCGLQASEPCTLPLDCLER